MTSVQPQAAASPPPSRGPFQFSLRTLLLLFVVAASSLGVFGAGGIAVFGVTVGLAIYLREFRLLGPLARLALIVFCLMCLIGLLLPAFNSVREAAYRESCFSKLCQLGCALELYNQANKGFPPAYTVGKDGTPLHSWRTLILPEMQYDYVYRKLDFLQPWDAPKNRKLLAFRPGEFACPSDPTSAAPGTMQTNYFAVVGPNTAWDRSRQLANTGEEASHTIMLVEVANSGINWAEPKDVPLESLGTAAPDSPALAPSSNHGGGHEDFFFIDDLGEQFDVAMADGIVRPLRIEHLAPEQFRRIFEIGGCTDEALRPGAGLYARRRLNWPNIAALAVWLASVGALLSGAVRRRNARFEPPSPN